MEIDHIRPQAAGGITSLDNLCLACIRCNRFKRDYLAGLDPETGHESPLYNPRSQRWADHFKWGDDRTVLMGLTATGRATIGRLRINDPKRLIARRNWVAAGWHPPEV